MLDKWFPKVCNTFEKKEGFWLFETRSAELPLAPAQALIVVALGAATQSGDRDESVLALAQLLGLALSTPLPLPLAQLLPLCAAVLLPLPLGLSLPLSPLPVALPLGV